jgi:hypothetical protein
MNPLPEAPSLFLQRALLPFTAHTVLVGCFPVAARITSLVMALLWLQICSCAVALLFCSWPSACALDLHQRLHCM